MKSVAKSRHASRSRLALCHQDAGKVLTQAAKSCMSRVLRTLQIRRFPRVGPSPSVFPPRGGSDPGCRGASPLSPELGTAGQGAATPAPRYPSRGQSGDVATFGYGKTHPASTTEHEAPRGNFTPGPSELARSGLKWWR